MNFTTGVEYLNQVISFDKLIFCGYLLESIVQIGNGSGDKKYKKKPNIAFGTRITDKPVLDQN